MVAASATVFNGKETKEIKMVAAGINGTVTMTTEAAVAYLAKRAHGTIRRLMPAFIAAIEEGFDNGIPVEVMLRTSDGVSRLTNADDIVQANVAGAIMHVYATRRPTLASVDAEGSPSAPITVEADDPTESAQWQSVRDVASGKLTGILAGVTRQACYDALKAEKPGLTAAFEADFKKGYPIETVKGFNETAGRIAGADPNKVLIANLAIEYIYAGKPDCLSVIERRAQPLDRLGSLL